MFKNDDMDEKKSIKKKRFLKKEEDLRDAAVVRSTLDIFLAICAAGYMPLDIFY